MKFSLLTISFLVAAEAFAPVAFRPAQSSQLEATKHTAWWGSAASAVATLAFCGQVATAAPLDDAMSASSLLVADKVEVLDFSLPSYDATTPSKSSSAPTFNPFGDFEPTFKKADPEATEETVASKEAEAAAKEEAAAAAKAEKEAKKAAEKAEKEAKKAAEKAEKEAKKAAADAAKAAAEAAGEAPSFEAPDITIPEFKAPDITIPDFKAPDIKMEMPDMPKIDIPKVDFTMPSFGKMEMPKMPDMPKVDMPKMPSASEYDLDVPKVDMPKVDMPKMDMPKIEMPKVSLPSFGGGGGGGSSEVLEPQEVRDEKARELRQVFLAADSDAKAAEEAARQVRNSANERLKEAKAAKNEACKTRPGGTILCLRNPFTAGF